MKTIPLILALLCALPAMAQTTVTATITDSDGQTWNNGHGFATFQPGPINAYKCASTITSPTNFTLDGSGTFTVSLADNTLCNPVGSTWAFTICPNASAKCYTSQQTVFGATQNLTTQLSSASVAPRFAATSSVQSYGYLDGEVTPIPVPGGWYFNVTGQKGRQWNGTAWQDFGGGGGGGVEPGTAFHVGVYDAPGTNIQNSGLFTDLTGNNLTVPGTTTSFQVNNDFYVAGAIVGSTVACPNGGNTQLECAANAANAWSNANSANVIIHLMAGVNSTSSGLSFTNTYAPSIVGDATFGSLIRQTASIANPAVSYGCNVFASSVTLQSFQIDADFNAPSGLYIGKNQVANFEGVTVIGANGTGTTSNFVQIGDNTCGGGGGATFEQHIQHLTVSGRGTGPGSWTVASCTGATASCSISNGGLYHWNTSKAYLVGYSAGTGTPTSKPCTTMGTLTPTFTVNGTWTWGETFYSQTLNTYTASGLASSGFSGCTGTMYVYMPDVPSPAYGVYAPFATDTVYDMLVVAGAGQTAGVDNENTANTYNGLHVYNGYIGYLANGGGGHIYGYDCDSNMIMMKVTGASPLQESGCNAFYPSASRSVFSGAIMSDLTTDTNHQSSFTQNNVVGGQGATPPDWHAFLQSDGPTDQTGNWPGSLVETASPTVNPAGNFHHDPSTNATNDVVGPEVQATASANVISPSRLLCENLWSGTASQSNCWAFQVTGSASGVPTQEIFNVLPPSNALAPVSGRFWLFQTPAAAPVNGSANVNSITVGFRGSYGNGSTAINIGWNWITQIGSGTTPSNTFFITPTSCPGTCQISTNANIVTTGSTSVSSPVVNLTNGGFNGAFTPATFSGAHVFTLPDATGQVPVAPAAVTTGRATCWKATGQIGFCSTQPDASGACTCN